MTTRNKRWRKSDVEKLKKLRLKRMPFTLIAKELVRTDSDVLQKLAELQNTALDRDRKKVRVWSD